MFEVGRLCVKIAGRDSGLKCVVVDIVDDKFVMIDGQTRRRKCNTKHLEPLKESIKLKKNASHKDVVSEFKKLKIDIRETKPKKPTKRPRKIKTEKVKLSEEDIKAAEKPKEEKTSSSKKETKKPLKPKDKKKK